MMFGKVMKHTISTCVRSFVPRGERVDGEHSSLQFGKISGF